jgi:4-hydroxy-tetrahydrodipicolinate synthase
MPESNAAVPTGIYAIPPTPFRDSGEIDDASLERCLDFIIAAGGHGVVMPVNASEAIALTDAERQHVTELTVAHVSKRVPVVIGVSGVSTEASVLYAEQARDAGADAVITMPPYVRHPPASEIFAFYEAVARAADPLPVWIQDYADPIGTPMPVDLLARMLGEIPGVNHVKEETALAPQVMTAIRDRARENVQGLMGGMAGRYLLEEYRRGATGSMPACEVTDVHVQVWEALAREDHVRAREIHTWLLPLLNYEAMYSFTIYKEILVRRGVISSARTRVPGAGYLDKENHREIDLILNELSPLFRL